MMLSTFRFLWREVSFADAAWFYIHSATCALVGHAWKEHSWWEGWDVGAGYMERWWECGRCEKFTREGPVG